MNDLEVFEYWDCFCGNMYGETGTMCYWNYYSGEISEEDLSAWEQRQEREEFMSDWNEYIDG